MVCDMNDSWRFNREGEEATCPAAIDLRTGSAFSAPVCLSVRERPFHTRKTLHVGAEQLD